MLKNSFLNFILLSAPSAFLSTRGSHTEWHNSLLDCTCPISQHWSWGTCLAYFKTNKTLGQRDQMDVAHCSSFFWDRFLSVEYKKQKLITVLVPPFVSVIRFFAVISRWTVLCTKPSLMPSPNDFSEWLASTSGVVPNLNMTNNNKEIIQMWAWETIQAYLAIWWRGFLEHSESTVLTRLLLSVQKQLKRLRSHSILFIASVGLDCFLLSEKGHEIVFKGWICIAWISFCLIIYFRKV